MSGYRPRPSPPPDIRPPTASRAGCGLIVLGCMVLMAALLVLAVQWLVTHV